ncbi:nitrile hydratase subunit alpha [Actinoallomurus iriomotensis]|uniref:Nitrile hydratase subunit alpha n=1 Tax=Actinoallomurus iriomotensis TaxID=478107 RepID=A0A9W6S575_9ACTN|nr:nitrile hydratase subunit alpha [Actinoallomurus iriomotensis]GLY87358.1 nitrile hydratase subunit alpha [Actinoallomurus iriomotensis]
MSERSERSGEHGGLVTPPTKEGSDDHEDLPVAARVRRLEERVVAAGLTTDDELDAILDGLLRNASPVNGARMVARAWTDPAYRETLLSDANAAAAELGFGTSGYRLRAVENTPAVHNVVVCTLCSCYPVSLLGPSPGWYRSFAYRSRVVREPRAVLEEFGLTLPDDVEIAVWDASAETRYLVVPRRPEGDLPEEELAARVTRRGLIGTAAV